MDWGCLLKSKVCTSTCKERISKTLSTLMLGPWKVMAFLLNYHWPFVSSIIFFKTAHHQLVVSYYHIWNMLKIFILYLIEKPFLKTDMHIFSLKTWQWKAREISNKLLSNNLWTWKRRTRIKIIIKWLHHCQLVL